MKRKIVAAFLCVNMVFSNNMSVLAADTQQETGTQTAADETESKAENIELGIVSSETAPSGGEMNVNIHATGNVTSVSYVEKATFEVSYDTNYLAYTGVQHPATGITVEDDSEKGILTITYKNGLIPDSDFSEYAETRLAKLNFEVKEVAEDTNTVIKIQNFHVYSGDNDLTDYMKQLMDVTEGEKTVTIYAKDSLDLNGDGVVGAGDVALADNKEQQEAIAGAAAIYPYKHAVVLTTDGGGSAWDPDSIYYAESNDVTPAKTSDPDIMAKRTNEYTMKLFNEEFATSYTAQAVKPSISGQNYSSIIHGIPWQDVDEEHRITNDSAAKEYYPDFGLETAKYPSMFKAVQKVSPNRSLAAFSEWSQILNGIIEPDAGVIGKVSASQESFYDVANYIKSDNYQNTAIVYMQSDYMDHIGHSTGYYNDTYWEEYKKYDDYFEAVINALKESGTYDETLIIANSDHGGSATGHGSTDPSNMDIFIGIGGQTVDSGERLEGGDNSDIAALVLDGLRIDKPESMTGEVFDTDAFLSQEEMAKKNRDIEKVTFTSTGKTATLALSNPKSETRVIDAVIDLDGAAVENIDAGEGTILRQEVEDGQLKLTISYESQPETLANITFDKELSDETAVDEIMLGTSEGKEIYPDLENVNENTAEEEIPTASVMDVDFTSGDATDNSETKNEYSVIGNPTITNSDELHKNVASFDGSSAYKYPFSSEKYAKITDKVTIECMFKYNNIPSSGEYDIFSNQQGGGIGLGLNNGKLTFFAHVAGSYKEPNATIKAGSWVHAVGVVDGSAVKLYVNGELVSEIAAEGGVKFPGSEGAWNFIIGGDSSSGNGAESFAEGSVSFARLYDEALSDEQIKALSEKAFEGVDLIELKAQQVNLGIVSSETAPSDGEMNVNLHINGDTVGTVDKVTYEVAYDSDLLTYNGVQHEASGVTIDDSTPGTLKVTYEGNLSTSAFSQYGSTRLAKLNFKVSEVAKDTKTVIETKNFKAYASGEEVTDQMKTPEAEKDVTIYAKDSLDLNGDGVVGAGDVALADSTEKKTAIAEEAAIYPYKHAVILTTDGGGSAWAPDWIYYAESNDVLPTKTSDSEIMAKRTNTYAMKLFNEEFATSYTASAVEPSISGQNYSSIIHGIPWADADATHQVTNSIASQQYYADFKLEIAKYPSMFKAVQKASPSRSTAAFAEWTEILNGIIEPDAGVIGKQSASKESFYDVANYIKSDEYQNTAIVYMQSDWMDHVGHSTGYYNDTYWSEYAQYDEYYKAVVDALKETGTYEETLIIANADHGGSDTGHGSTDPSNMDIFIGIGGQTVNSGQRLEGGDNSDIAAIALYGLRIDKPESMTGEVFDTNAFLSQEEMVQKNRDIEKITFTKTGKSATLSLSNPKSETRVIDAVIDLDGAKVESIDAGEGTILRQEVENDQLKLTVSYESQPEALAKITFEKEPSTETAVDEIMLGTAEGKEVYPDLENKTEALSVNKDALNEKLAAVQNLQANEYTASTWLTFNEAYKTAKAIAQDTLAEQEEVDAATKKLETAIDGLEKTLDKSALSQKISYADIMLNKLEALVNNFTQANAELNKAIASLNTKTTTEATKTEEAQATATPEPTASTATTTEVKAGTKFTVGSLNYKVTSAGNVTVTGVEKKNIKTVTIPAEVTYQGTKLKVTAISARAFKGCASLTKVTIGKNVTTIGSNAFYGDKKLTKIVIKSTTLKKVGSKAIKGIGAKAVITVPKNKVTSYKKLFQKAGLKSTMQIKN